MRKTLLGVLSGMLLLATSAHSQEPTRAAFWKETDKVVFWQTNHLSGNQGTCVVKFGFDGATLKQPIENLTLTIRIVARNGTDLGVNNLVLFESFGASGAGRYTEGTFEGVAKWPDQDDGQWSPLCDEGATLIVESAIGKQAGRVVDLLRFNQLEFTSFRKVTVKLKK